MILLLGGTSETSLIATGLAKAGYDVLVSTATEIALDTGSHPRIVRRQGRLDEEGMIKECRQNDITAIVDATHPFAWAAHATARQAALRREIPCITFCRPSVISSDAGVLPAAGHDQAADIAFSLDCPVLLTTGSKNLEPYVAKSRATGIPLFVRVLNEPESVEACRRAGIDERCIITGRGPFSVEENRQDIRKYKIGVLVTKESGTAGGIEAKLEAAKKESCRVVVIQRPEMPQKNVYSSIDDLIAAIPELLPNCG